MFIVLLASLMALALTPAAPAPAWRTPFENEKAGNTTATYAECLAYYQKLAAACPRGRVRQSATEPVSRLPGEHRRRA